MSHQFRVVNCSPDDTGIARSDVLATLTAVAAGAAVNGVLAAVAPAFVIAAGTGLALICAVAAWALLWPLDRAQRADRARRIAGVIKVMIISSGAYAGAGLMYLAVERDLTTLMIGAWLTMAALQTLLLIVIWGRLRVRKIAGRGL